MVLSSCRSEVEEDDSAQFRILTLPSFQPAPPRKRAGATRYSAAIQRNPQRPRDHAPARSIYERGRLFACRSRDAQRAPWSKNPRPISRESIHPSSAAHRPRSSADRVTGQAIANSRSKRKCQHYATASSSASSPSTAVHWSVRAAFPHCADRECQDEKRHDHDADGTEVLVDLLEVRAEQRANCGQHGSPQAHPDS